MNKNLNKAKVSKNDEFYTSYEDVEKEIDIYYNNDNDIFKDKTILLPCNDYDSNFYKYFFDNYSKFNYKKLISISYNSENNGRYKEHYMVFKNEYNLNGSGDFRSEEVTKLRDEADFIFTNPPFSLFREFVDWLKPFKGKYSIIGNMNAIKYKNVFPLIKEEKMWLGVNNNRMLTFQIPNHYEVKSEDMIIDGIKYAKVPAIWFTNIEHGVRNSELELMSMEDNLKYSRRKIIREKGYQKYDNYDAIEVPFVEAIPSDYDGVMGVPISFLTKYNPNQFKILGSQRWSKSKELLDVYIGDIIPRENDLKTIINGRETYDRIFIKHKK